MKKLNKYSKEERKYMLISTILILVSFLTLIFGMFNVIASGGLSIINWVIMMSGLFMLIIVNFWIEKECNRLEKLGKLYYPDGYHHEDMNTKQFYKDNIDSINNSNSISNQQLIPITLWFMPIYDRNTYDITITCFLSENSVMLYYRECDTQRDIISGEVRSIQTYEGSDIYLQAMKNEENLIHLQTKL